MRATVLACVGLFVWGCGSEAPGDPGWLCSAEGPIAGECYRLESVPGDQWLEHSMRARAIAYCQTGPERPVCWSTADECGEWYRDEGRECVKVLRYLRK